MARSPVKRAGLDRATVVLSAAELINAEGVEALSLSRLADRLGVQTPSLYNHVDGLPGLRRELALLNARLLGDCLAKVAIGKSGSQAFREVAGAYREYIKSNPGLYSASLRVAGSQAPLDVELQTAEDRLVAIGLAVVGSFDLDGENGLHAVRSLRSVVHGFALLEVAGGFGLPLDCDESFHRLVEMLIEGLQHPHVHLGQTEMKSEKQGTGEMYGPTLIQAGLAMYDTGAGEPVLLMPYPHGFGGAPIVQGALAEVLRQARLRVVSFDPPGMFQSTRPAWVSMAEMLACAEETLHALDIQAPLILAGHSMGGLCAIALALAHPELVKKLILIGTLSGGSAISRHKGMPWGRWLTGLDRWRFTFYGLRLSLGMGNLVVHKRLRRLLDKASYVNKGLIPVTEIATGDRYHPAPVRDRWSRLVMAQKLEYRLRIGEIAAPTLVCAGRYDPQAPVGCSQELAEGIPGARLEVFEHSGHYPFIEEQESFKTLLTGFIRRETEI